MKADPASCNSNLPYWTNFSEGMPDWLSEATQDSPDDMARDWLVLPHEGVGNESYQEFAICAQGEALKIRSAVSVNGATVYELNPEECSGVKFESRLLLHRVTIFDRAGEAFSFQYNGAKEHLDNEVMGNFIGALEERSVRENSFYAEASDVELRTSFARKLAGFFARGESFVAALQQSTVYHLVKRWFTDGLVPVPASAVAMSAGKVVIASATFDGKPEKFGETVMVVPLDCVDSLEMVQADDETLAMQVRFGAEKAEAVFSTRVFPSLYSQAESVCAAYRSVVGIQKMRAEVLQSATSAQQELVRLTGVDLPEPEALEALVQIHRYKWLEAERAGFDTWAVIQPENPLRAAAVHWVRKYFGQFEEAMQRGAA